MANKSYYEQLLKKKTRLYPNGQKLTLMQKYARQAEFGRNLPKPKRNDKPAESTT